MYTIYIIHIDCVRYFQMNTECTPVVKKASASVASVVSVVGGKPRRLVVVSKPVVTKPAVSKPALSKPEPHQPASTCPPACEAEGARGLPASTCPPACEAEGARGLPATYVQQTMLTCLGNKRLLVGKISGIAEMICERLGKSKLRVLDGFSGSAVVSRELSYLASELHSNDLEEYACLIARCSLETPSASDRVVVAAHISAMNALARDGPHVAGFVSRLYAPVDTENIRPGERCFYTQENARAIDTLRQYIDAEVPLHLRHYCLVPLLTKASIHANTSGVFKGFHSEGGVGKWGGSRASCLPRIKGAIQLDMPVWNTESSFVPHVTGKDVNVLMREFAAGSLDLVYLDPPYNQHPYGSNYFMLNLIAGNCAPADETLSRKSGIPNTWTRSSYNYKKSALQSMTELVCAALEKSAYVLISYNNEGIISDEEWVEMFSTYHVEKFEVLYNAYRGSRNLAGRNDKVMERMYLVCCGETPRPLCGETPRPLASPVERG
jgi:adenine-specific DNA-methyltransferase